MNIFEIIQSADKILIGLGNNVYRKDPLPEDYTDWQTIKKYLTAKTKHKEVNTNLLKILDDKDYFIITSSWDNHLTEYVKENRFFTPNGNCRKMQCYNACTTELWDFEDLKDKKDHPRCPHCNALLIMNIATDAFFVKDKYDLEENSYYHWLHKNYNEKILIIEWQSRDNETRIISKPFENIATALPNVTFLRINSKKIPIPANIKDGIEIKFTINQFIKEIQSHL